MVQKPTVRARPAFHRRIGEDGRYNEPFAALAAAYERRRADPQFLAVLDDELERIAQRPSPLHDAQRLTRAIGGARILLKREDQGAAESRLLLAVAGEALIARQLGRTALVTSTSTGPRGLVTAAVAVRLGLKAIVFMDRDDRDRHKEAVLRLQLLGAELKTVTLRELPERDVRLPALEFWAQEPQERFPVLGLDAGPAAYDALVREIPSVIGRETRRQAEGINCPALDLLVARGGETADAIGFFEPFLASTTRLVCVEPSRDLGIKRRDDLFGSAPGPSADTLKRFAQADLAAREYAPVLREHAALHASGRVEYVKAAPEAARKALFDAAGLEGIAPSIETAHAIAWACGEAAKLNAKQTVVVMLAESADRDLPLLGRLLEGSF